MNRIKGYIGHRDSKGVSDKPWKSDDIYVEEIPSSAIQGEADVKFAQEDYQETKGCIKVPATLIGKRVRYIIFVED